MGKITIPPHLKEFLDDWNLKHSGNPVEWPKPNLDGRYTIEVDDDQLAMVEAKGMSVLDVLELYAQNNMGKLS